MANAHKNAYELNVWCNNIRRELTGAADSYVGDIMAIALCGGWDESGCAKAWSLFWALPTLSGYGWHSNRTRPYSPMAYMVGVMEKVFGPCQWPENPTNSPQQVAAVAYVKSELQPAFENLSDDEKADYIRQVEGHNFVP